MPAAIKSTIVPVLDNETIKSTLERVSKNNSGYVFDTSMTLDGSSCQSGGGCVFDLGSDPSELPSYDSLPEVEAMRAACASGELTSVQAVFQTWLDQPTNERIDNGLLGAEGLCEAIKRDDAIIGSFLLSHVLSINDGHFAMATKYRSYSILQLFIDRGWDINTSLGRWQPPALS